MGKVRRLRQKYHASLVKDAEKTFTSQTPNVANNAPQLVPQVESGATRDQKSSENIFAGLQIRFQTVDNETKEKSVGLDGMSVISLNQESQKGTKIDKRKKRREHLIKKIDVIRAGQRAEKDRKKRENTIITGDLHPLLNALPSLEELTAAKSKDMSNKSRKPRGTPKQKKMQQEVLSDIQMFTSIHQDPQFSQEPFRAVALALENRVLHEDD